MAEQEKEKKPKQIICPILCAATVIAATTAVISPERIFELTSCNKEHCAIWCSTRNCCGLKQDVGETLISDIDDDDAYGDEHMIIRDEDDKP